MKYFKFILINIIVFGGLITGISLLFPSVIHTSKTINIASGNKKILDKITDIKTWRGWNVFTTADSTTTVTRVNNTDNVTTSWGFNKGHNIKCEIVVYKATGDSTPVSFMVTEKLKWYPWEKFRAMVSDKAIGNAVEASLDKLKKQLETDH